MPIVYEGYGNILTHKAQTIACPVNTVGVMGAGIALAMRNRIRGLMDFYKKHCQEGTLAVGRCVTYPIPKKEQQVLLFPTKAHWKDPSEVAYIEEALEYLVEHLATLNVTELALPPIGCGLGKLDYYKEVRPLIHKYLGDVDIDVYVLLRDNI